MRRVAPADPVTALGAVLLLGAISLLASALPTLRAVRFDAKRALREG